MSRIFTNLHEAINEIRRDLAELSQEYPSGRWQARDVSGDESFAVKELTNYLYTVTTPLHNDLRPDLPWADTEFDDRICVFDGSYDNPGEAWKLRRVIWEPLLEETGEFSYTYPERMNPQIDPLLETIMNFPSSRQLFLSIWDPSIDIHRLEVRRVPCSLGYYFKQGPTGCLDMTYLQRSCDFVTHFQNDVYLAVRFLDWVCAETKLERGMFSHWIGSLHVFAKDVEGVY